MPRRNWILLLGLLFLTRAILVLALADVFFYGEELAKGAAAKGMLDGLPLPHFMRNYAYHEGGGFTMTHLKALAFLLVGENVLAHKLVALVWCALILAAGLWLSQEHLGKRAAFYFGLFFVLAPEPMLRFSLLNLGTHFEALLFIALVLHFTLRIARAVESQPRLAREEAQDRRDHLFLGLAAGFGLYFSLQLAPAIACAGLYLLWARRTRLFDRAGALALVGFLVGAAPLWWMMSHVGLAALRLPSQGADGDRASIAEGLAGLASCFGPELGFFDWLRLAVLVAASLAALVFVRGSTPRTRSNARFVFAYAGLFLVLYLVSGFAIGKANWFFYLRLAPLWFASLCCAAAGLAALAARSRGSEVLVRAVVLVLAIGGALDLLHLVQTGRTSAWADNWRILRTSKGYDYDLYFDKLVHHMDGDERHKIDVLRSCHDDPNFLWPSITHSLFDRSGHTLDEAARICEDSFGEGWLIGVRGLGLLVDPNYGHDLDGGFARIAAAPAEHRSALAEALGRIAYGLRTDEERLLELAALPIDPVLRPSFLRGVGHRIALQYRLRPDRAESFLARLPTDSGKAVRAGYQAALGELTLQ